MQQSSVRSRLCLSACLAAVTAVMTCTCLAPAQDSRPATQPGTRKINVTFARDTTYILGPALPDGTPDYVAWLDAHLSKGVTPDNNAAVLLVRALGPGIFPEQTGPRILKRLGIASLPAEGDYFLPFLEYVAKHSPPEKLKHTMVKVSERRLREMAGHVSPEELERIRAEGLPEGPSQAQAEANRQRELALAGPWAAKDLPIMAGWLEANAKPLALVVAATKCRHYYLPALPDRNVPSLVSLLLPGVGTPLHVAEPLAARAMLRFGADDVDGARTDILAIHRLARLVAQGATLVERLVAAMVEGRACRADAALATSGKLTAAQAKAMLGNLRALGPLGDMGPTSDIGERLYSLSAVMLCARTVTAEAPAGDRDRIDWNQILRRFNAFYDRLAAIKRIKGKAARQKALNDLYRDVGGSREEVIRSLPNLQDPGAVRALLELARAGAPDRSLTDTVGDTLLAAFTPEVVGLCNARDHQVAAMDLARVAFALAAYRKEKGAYPAQLAALSPAYLRTIPRDVFTDKPLVYKPQAEGYLLYSVGVNLKDDGGANDLDEKDDIAVRAER